MAEARYGVQGGPSRVARSWKKALGTSLQDQDVLPAESHRGLLYATEASLLSWAQEIGLESVPRQGLPREATRKGLGKPLSNEEASD